MHFSVERSLSLFPGGSNGEFNLPPEASCVIARGEGCRLWTTEGREMVDFSMGWGSALVGHARDEIVAAVTNQVGNGANFAYVTAASLELAEELVRLSPACDRIRFCASGTEATMYCLRLARAFTGRPKILKFEGAYHGAHDVGVTSLFPHREPVFPIADPSSAGLHPQIEDCVLVAPFNDLGATSKIVARHADELAAVIVEPLQRCVPPLPGFLQGLKELTRSHGIQLVFDEVVTGFRLAYGGAQEAYGVVPDLVAYGKALGGGMPIGAYGGSADIMELVSEDRMNRDTYVWTASTLGGNPVSTAAASAALAIFREPDTYPKLQSLGEYLRRLLREVLLDKAVVAQVLGDGPLAQVAFTDCEVHDYRSSQHKDSQMARRVMLRLFTEGIFLNPMGTKLYLSLAHERADCDRLADVFARALAQLQVASAV